AQYPMMEKYVKAIVGKFANDDRIIMWDVWNEPDNMTGPSYEKVETPDKVDLVLPLLKKTFEWARAANPVQPLTSGVWAGNWESDSTLKPLEKLQLEESDIISFHCYDDSVTLAKKIKELQRYNKPLICTEYMARPNGSTFQSSLPVAKENKVAMVNWGFVDGKSQTIYPWDSWTKKYTAEPPLWFHDIFRKDGTPYKQEETDFIKKMTGKL
ncbi:MAG TPA: cellulase family glycosylhydrolase, partial [Niabella sp.]|nr:cellulase family glycosylhydrolase [Niabella sp.]